MSWTDDLPGIKGLRLEGGTPIVPRKTLRVLGDARVLDNPAQQTTDLTVEDTLAWVYADVPDAESGQHDNYVISGFNLATDVGLAPADSDYDITGFAFEGSSSAAYRKVKRIWRLGSGSESEIILKNQTGSLPEHQIITPGGVDLAIPLNGFVMLVRDPVARAWRAMKLLGA